MKRKAFTKAERQTIYDKTDGHCAYCGEKIEIKAMQVDHVAPMEYAELIKLDGFDPNHLGNLLPACRSCNYIKATFPLEAFRNRIYEWPNVLKRDSVTYRNAVRLGVIAPTGNPAVFYFEKIGLLVTDYLSGLNEMYRKAGKGEVDHD